MTKFCFLKNNLFCWIDKIRLFKRLLSAKAYDLVVMPSTCLEICNKRKFHISEGKNICQWQHVNKGVKTNNALIECHMMINYPLHLGFNASDMKNSSSNTWASSWCIGSWQSVLRRIFLLANMPGIRKYENLLKCDYRKAKGDDDKKD